MLRQRVESVACLIYLVFRNTMYGTGRRFGATCMVCRQWSGLPAYPRRHQNSVKFMVLHKTLF